MKARLVSTSTIFFAVLLACSAAGAAEFYVVRFRTDPLYPSAPCVRFGWIDELIFYNANQTPATVKNLGTTSHASLGQVEIPPKTLLSSNSFSGDALGGVPDTRIGIAVNKLGVPDGVTVASRAQVFGPIGCVPQTSFDYQGSLPLPVVAALTEPNLPQVHLATDLGRQERHTNVIIYNGGTTTATATIELRQGCGFLIETRTARIDPNSVIQIARFTDEAHQTNFACTFPALMTQTSRYVIVTVDQPSFSNVITVSDEFAVPTIGASVASIQ